MVLGKIISRLERSSCLYGFRNFFVFLSIIIELGWDLTRFLPPFVRPEIPRCGPDQISAMYVLGFISAHSFMKLVWSWAVFETTAFLRFFGRSMGYQMQQMLTNRKCFFGPRCGWARGIRHRSLLPPVGLFSHFCIIK